MRILFNNNTNIQDMNLHSGGAPNPTTTCSFALLWQLSATQIRTSPTLDVYFVTRGDPPDPRVGTSFAVHFCRKKPRSLRSAIYLD
jgi:hypothetical protein